MGTPSAIPNLKSGPQRPTVNFSAMFHKPCGTALFPPTEIRIGPGPGRKSTSLIRSPHVPSPQFQVQKKKKHIVGARYCAKDVLIPVGTECCAKDTIIPIGAGCCAKDATMPVDLGSHDYISQCPLHLFQMLRTL